MGLAKQNPSSENNHPSLHSEATDSSTIENPGKANRKQGEIAQGQSCHQLGVGLENDDHHGPKTKKRKKKKIEKKHKKREKQVGKSYKRFQSQGHVKSTLSQINLSRVRKWPNVVASFIFIAQLFGEVGGGGGGGGGARLKKMVAHFRRCWYSSSWIFFFKGLDRDLNAVKY